MTATGKNCDQMHTENETAEAAVAIHGCEYLPTYAAYTNYKAGMSYLPDRFQDLHLDAV